MNKIFILRSSDCKVAGNLGDSTTQGTCNNGLLCFPDGECKGRLLVFIALSMCKNIVIWLNRNAKNSHIPITIECLTDEDCFGASDTCISNVCHCGSNARCSGKTNKCTKGICKCGENDECSSTEICSLGKCVGN